MPGQKPKAVEHDRAKETVKVDDRHLAWKEEGMPDSLEWCDFPFFKVNSVGRCWDPQERKDPRLLNLQGTALAADTEKPTISGAGGTRMECRIKGILTGNNFAWNARWSSFSLWSRATPASLVKSEKLVWLEEPAGITQASATFMLIVRKRLTCVNSELLIPGNGFILPQRLLVESSPKAES